MSQDILITMTSPEANPAGITASSVNGVPVALIRNPGAFGRNGARLAAEIMDKFRETVPGAIHPNAK